MENKALRVVKCRYVGNSAELLNTVALAKRVREKVAADRSKAAQEIAASLDEQRRAAHSEGFRAGYSAGKLAAHQKLESELDAFGSLLNKLFKQAERDCLTFALDLAERVLNKQVQEDPTPLLTIIKREIEKLRGRYETVELRVHPKCLAQLGAKWQTSAIQVKISSDGSLSPSEAAIDTPAGSLSFGLNHIFLHYKEELLKECA